MIEVLFDYITLLRTTLETLGDGKAYADPAGFMFHSLIIGKLDQAADWAARAIDQRWPVIVDFTWISQLRICGAARIGPNLQR